LEIFLLEIGFGFSEYCCSFDEQHKDTFPHGFTQEQNNPFIGVQYLLPIVLIYVSKVL
jgi:hypothetical protein